MKKLLALVLITVMLLSVYAVGAAAEVKQISENALIGIVLPTKEESRWLNDQKYFEEYFKDMNYDILFSQNNTATEKTNVETFISRGAEVIVLCAYDAAGADVVPFLHK